MSLRIFIKFPTFASMKNMKWSLKGYLLAFLCFEFLGFLFVGLKDRQSQMELINLNHTPFFDGIFVLITNTAEVILPIGLLAYFGFKQKSLVKPYVFSYAISTLVVQVLKHLIFTNSLRPILFLKQSNIKWHLVEGLAINEMNSFPSGHTNAAWWMYFWLAYLMPNKYAGFLFGLLAFGVAYSRVYLFQHFPIDTLFGAIFGCMGSLIAYYLFVLKKDTNA